MSREHRPVEALPATMRVRDVVIRGPIVIGDGYGDDSNTLQFTVGPRSFRVHVTNPDHPAGNTFVQSRSRLTIDAALAAMRDDGSYSPGLHDDSGIGHSIHAEGLEDWIKEILGVGYVAHSAAEAMAGRTVGELLRVRARFPEGLASEDSIYAFGRLFSVTDETRFQSLSLEQMAEVSGCPDPEDIERLADCLEETDDKRVPDVWLPRPRTRVRGRLASAALHEAPGVSAATIAACADAAAFAKLVEGPPPRTREAMAEALRGWMRFPTEAQIRGSGFGFRSRTLIVRWAGGWTAVCALRELDPAGAVLFQAEFKTVSTKELDGRRNSRATGVAGMMSSAAAGIVEKFVELMRAQEQG